MTAKLTAQGVAAALLVTFAAACGGSGSTTPAAPSTLTVRGTLGVEPQFTLHAHTGGPCQANQDNYADIHDGTQLVVEDSSGKTVGLGTLAGPGRLSSAAFTGKCVFTFAVSGVPAGSAFYRVAVQGHGSQQYTRAQIGSALRLTLG